MPIGLEGVSGGVMAHPSLQAERVGALLDQQSGARVAKGMESDAAELGALGGGLEDVAAQCVRT